MDEKDKKRTIQRSQVSQYDQKASRGRSFGPVPLKDDNPSQHKMRDKGGPKTAPTGVHQQEAPSTKTAPTGVHQQEAPSTKTAPTGVHQQEAPSTDQSKGARPKTSTRSRPHNQARGHVNRRDLTVNVQPRKGESWGIPSLLDLNVGHHPRMKQRSSSAHGFQKREQSSQGIASSANTCSGKDKHRGAPNSCVQDRTKSLLRSKSQHSMNRIHRAEHLEVNRLTKSQMMEMLSADPENIILKITSSKSGLKELLDSTVMDDDTLGVMLELICKSLMARTPHSVHLLLQLINDSKLLPGPITQLLGQGLSKSLSEKTLENILVLLKSVLQRFPTTALQNVAVIQSHLVKIGKSPDMNDCIKIQLEDFDQMKSCIQEQIKEDLCTSAPSAGKASENLAKPPNDFRKISVVPTKQDIFLDDEPFLQKNRVKGSYQSAEQYLDIQFRLLREDFIRPLRDGINELKQLKQTGPRKSKRFQDVRVYNKVIVGIPIHSDSGIVYEVKFDVSCLRKVRWESSKRLIYGSLVCLSEDNFETLVFGTVAERNLGNLKEGYTFIDFESTSFHTLNPNPSTVYEMVECSALFEAYRHNLERLQKITTESLPFKKYILDGKVKEVSCPRYIQERGVEYDVSCLCNQLRTGEDRDDCFPVPILEKSKWPGAKEMGLDESQYHALQTGLTKEFVVIQGPPGTGKTFLGLKMMQVFLRNKRVWNPKPLAPILVVCNTNHALDQFLEGIISAEKLKPGELIRIGSRSKSDKLENFILRKVKKDKVNLEKFIKDEIDRYSEEQENLKKGIEKVSSHVHWAKTHIINEMKLQHIMPSHHRMSLIKHKFGTNCVVLRWLLVMDTPNNEQSNSDDTEMTEDETNFNGEEMQHIDAEREIEGVKSISPNYENIMKNVEDLEEVNLEETWTEVSKERVAVLKEKLRLCEFDVMPEDEACCITDVWKLKERDRLRLYRYWISLYIMDKLMSIRPCCQKHQDCTGRLKELKSQEDFQILTNATVIGMTITGAAKYRSIIQRVQPRIIIVEEAAEVLEAHIITTLSPNCQHLIMIGDHQQLRPNPTVYKLAKNYHLDISLFERMVKNNIHCDRLLIQHRMRPEIVKLIVPHVYKDLQNHRSVLEYENVMGVTGNVFFVTHKEEETAVDDTRSRSNKHEAEYLVAFCRYLLQQGYDASQITILVMYTGQMFLVMKKFYDDKSIKELIGNNKVRITPVDNYQGEENDIILLSLVRSNEEGRIGFLSIQNRVCVALSRAKKGFYVIGNLTLLEDASSLWKNIAEDLRSEARVVEGLPLACKNHPETRIHAVSSEDFSKAPKGGCMKPCNYRLPCGHVCAHKCHPTDPKHEAYKCLKRCEKMLCEREHQCPRLCYERCIAECREPVEKLIPHCGHTQMVPCHAYSQKFTCKMPCEKLLKCGHQCQGLCGQDCIQECTVIIPDREWPCGHRLTMECSKNPINFECKEPIEVTLLCGHTILALCSDALESIVCTKLVTVTTCTMGHDKEVPCNISEETKLEPCTKQITKMCKYNDQHEYIVECSKSGEKLCPLKCNTELPCRHFCKGKCSKCHEFNVHPDCMVACKTRLLCGHKCQGTCGAPCPPCKVACTWQCGHQLYKYKCGQSIWQCRKQCTWRCRHQACNLQCWEACQRSPCNWPCPSILVCGHACTGLCGEICPSICRICHVKYLQMLERSSRIKSTETARLLMLHPCGHCIDVDQMDAYMSREPERGGPHATLLTPFLCPACSTPIQDCPRYNALLKTYRQDFEKVKMMINYQHAINEAVMKALSMMHTQESSLMTDQANLNIDSSRDLQGRIAVICMVEECKQMRANIERAVNQHNSVMTWEELSIFEEMLHPISQTLTANIVDVKTILPIVIILFLICYVKMAITNTRNYGKRRHLKELASALEREERRRVHAFRHTKTIQEVLFIVNATLVNTLGQDQTHGIQDLGIKIREFFKMKLDQVKDKVWLKCDKGHVYFGNGQSGVEERRCPDCNTYDRTTWLDELFEEETKTGYTQWKDHHKTEKNFN